MTLRPLLTTGALLLLLNPMALAQKSGGGIGTMKRGGPPDTRPLPGRLDRSRLLPDTVLARVPGRADLTLHAFRQAAERAGQPADSLTPQGRREFLGLLIERELLAAKVAEEHWVWPARDSAQYVALRDRLALDAVLEAALAETARRRARAGQAPLEDRGALGVAARESALVLLAPHFHDDLVERVAAAFDSLPKRSPDMSLGEQLRVAGLLPLLAPADTSGVLAESRVGSYTVPQLMSAWRKLNPLYRPRVDGVGAVHDLIANGLFERYLREQAAANHLEQHPAMVRTLHERAELTEITLFVQREVYDRIARDSLTLQRHFRANRQKFEIPAHALLLRMTLPTREAAGRMAQRLTDPVEAESLVVRGTRHGADFRERVTAASDSSLYARARSAGIGAVLPPDSTAEGWRAVRVMAMEKAHVRTFDEARQLVAKDWVDREAERRMRALLDDLKRRRPVLVNDRVLARPSLPAEKAPR